MPFDHLDRFSWREPAGRVEAAAASRAAELALSRRLMPGEDWAEVPLGGDVAFDAAREAFRAAHSRSCEWADDEAVEEDPDAWEDEPFGD